MDGGGAVSGSTLAFTNLPYIPDAGAGCGQSFVNAGSAGTLDGVTIVEGHEYAETITDQYPAGGWITPSGLYAGDEVGDLCAWIRSGQGAATNLVLSTGSFAVQSVWANDYNGGQGGCETSHPIVTNPSANTVTVTNPGNQTGAVGTAVNLQIQASDSASGQTLTYSATGLPAGLSINSSSGLITGTPTTAVTASVTVTATDTTGASGGASFSWTIPAPNTVTVTNPGGQASAYGASASLQISAGDSATGQTLTYGASGLPAGLSINASTGLISGTATAVGSSNVTVTATDTTNSSASTSFTWTVTKAGTQLVASTATTGHRTFTFHATLTSAVSGAPVAGRTVSFSVNGKTYCQATTSTSGAASCSTSSKLSGTTYTATFAGDADYLASSGNAAL
jgi:serine protease